MKKDKYILILIYLCFCYNLVAQMSYPDVITAVITQPNGPNCDGGIIDLTIVGAVEPYDINWYYIGPDFINPAFVLAGALAGGEVLYNGEDLQIVYDSSTGLGWYAVLINDALCGFEIQMYYIDCDPCDNICSYNCISCTNSNCNEPAQLDLEIDCEEERSWVITWTDIDGNLIADSDFDNLGPGDYLANSVDEYGCEMEQYARVIGGETTFEVELVNFDNESISGNCDGSIDIEVISGNPPYTFQWSNASELLLQLKI